MPCRPIVLLTFLQSKDQGKKLGVRALVAGPHNSERTTYFKVLSSFLCLTLLLKMLAILPAFFLVGIFLHGDWSAPGKGVPLSRALGQYTPGPLSTGIDLDTFGRLKGSVMVQDYPFASADYEEDITCR
jgi:hypothetical protein